MLSEITLILYSGRFLFCFLHKMQDFSFLSDKFHLLAQCPQIPGSFESLFLSSNALDTFSSFMNLIAWDHQLKMSQQYSVAVFIKLTVIVKYINRSVTSKS